jgi:sortase A
VIRRLFALTGELLLITASVIGLYLLYQAWFTNFDSDQRAVSIASEIKEQFLEPESASGLVEVKNEPFDGIGLLYIPKLKDDVWGVPVLSDVSSRALASGVGHYPGTALPGQEGNFAIAAHRATYGEPFARFEQLASGDRVFIQTLEGYFEYQLFADQKIPDTDTWVIAEKPDGLTTSSSSLITLTTCDPRWNSTQRWARWGELISFSKTMPEELAQ